MIQEARVGCVTGRSFYDDPADGATKLRFCFGKELDDLKQACRQIRDAFGT
jgi:aminotransferase